MTGRKGWTASPLGMSDGPKIIFSTTRFRETLVIHLSGSLEHRTRVARIRLICEKRWLLPAGSRQIAFDTQELGAWDSSLLTFLIRVIDIVHTANALRSIKDGLPEGVVKLLALASAVPEQKDARKAAARVPFLNRIGAKTLGVSPPPQKWFPFLGKHPLLLSNYSVAKPAFVALIWCCSFRNAAPRRCPLFPSLAFLWA